MISWDGTSDAEWMRAIFFHDNKEWHCVLYDIGNTIINTEVLLTFYLHKFRAINYGVDHCKYEPT